MTRGGSSSSSHDFWPNFGLGEDAASPILHLHWSINYSFDSFGRNKLRKATNLLQLFHTLSLSLHKCPLELQSTRSLSISGRCTEGEDDDDHRLGALTYYRTWDDHSLRVIHVNILNQNGNFDILSSIQLLKDHLYRGQHWCHWLRPTYECEKA